MLLEKLWRTMGLYKAQFISMIIMIAIGVGVFCGFNIEWTSIRDDTAKFFKETGFADYRIANKAGFTKQDEEKIKNIDGVDETSRYLAVNVSVESVSGTSLSLTVTENKKVSFFKIIEGEEYSADDEDGVWLSDKFAKENSLKVGDEIKLAYESFSFSGKIKGLIKAGEYLICVRDETQLMPDYEKFAFCYVSPAFFKKATGFEYYPQINVISSLEKNEFKDKVNSALEKTTLVYTKDEVTSYAQMKGEEEEGKTMGSILPVLFLAIAVLTMVTTMHRLTAKEKTQIGTLKALGFKDKRILRHYTSYAFTIGVIGSAIGIALGFALAYFIMNPNGSMGTYFDMPYWGLTIPWFGWVVIAGIIVVLTFIGFLSVKQMLKGTAADSLRPYTPKKMKKIALEKTPLWNKFSFGAKWNMRDIMRHKSRTLMSLIGIVGCMIIIVGSLGMRDTMDGFLNLYYDGAMNYNTKIFVSDEATKAQTDKIIEDYNGDSSGTVYVETGEKMIALDVYNLKNDSVRFPDKDDNFVTLKNDGAYICTRLATKFSLKAGDEIEVSPYGSDKKYTLKINGVIRSITENIVVTSDYANSLGIAFDIDSVYTKTEKDAVKLGNGVKSVQSKNDIIESFDTFTEIMNMMIVILVAAALVLGVVVLYNLGVMSYTERYREMATLKVVGFKDKKIGSLLIGQNLWVTLVGVVIGLPLGFFTLKILVDALATEYEMRAAISPLSCIISIALIFLTSLLVSFLVSKKNKKIDMVEALKAAE